MGKVVFKELVYEPNKRNKKSELNERSLGSVEMDSPPRAKGSLIFFNEKLYRVYKSFDWIYLNQDGTEQTHLELILDSEL